jgi:hypothetical protein
MYPEPLATSTPISLSPRVGAQINFDRREAVRRERLRGSKIQKKRFNWKTESLAVSMQQG